jgi:hypothetical protein
MTLAEQWQAQGEARGEAKGEARGEAKGEARGEARGELKALRQVLIRQLVLKFGSISASDQARIDAAAKDELWLWNERILGAGSPGAVFDG